MKSSRFIISVIVSAIVFGLIDQICYWYIGKVYALGFIFRASLPFYGMVFYLFLALGMYTYARKMPFKSFRVLEAVNVLIFGIWMFAAMQWLNAPTWDVFIHSNTFWLSIGWGGVLSLVTWGITELLLLTIKKKL